MEQQGAPDDGDDRPTSRRRFISRVGSVGALGIASVSGCLQTTTLEGTAGPDMMPLMQMGMSPVAGAPKHGDYPAVPNDDGFVDVLMIAYEDQSDNYHFMPHVAWVEPGTTVRWMHTAEGISEPRTHSATAITSATMGGYPRLIPEGAEPFDSGFLPGVHAKEYQEITKTGIDPGPYTHTFDQEGVYFYVCQNHYGVSGMAGAIVVGELWEETEGGPGWSPGMTADLSGIPEVDPVNGPTIQEKIEHDLRAMIHAGGEPEEEGH